MPDRSKYLSLLSCFIVIAACTLHSHHLFHAVSPDQYIHQNGHFLGILPGTFTGFILGGLIGIIMALPILFLTRSITEWNLAGLSIAIPIGVRLAWMQSPPIPVRILSDSALGWYLLLIVTLAIRRISTRKIDSAVNPSHRSEPAITSERRIIKWLIQPSLKQVIVIIAVIELVWAIGSIELIIQTPLIRQDEPTGDEPEYIMLARSLWDDGDYNLVPDEKLRRDREFMSGQFHLRHKSFRPPGFPSLLIPAYLAGRHIAWPGLPYSLYLFMSGIYTLIAIELCLMLFQLSRDTRIAGGLTLIALFTLPLLPFSSQVYPETIAAWIVLRLFRRLFFPLPNQHDLWDGFLLAIIPILHQKYMFLLVSFGIFIICIMFRKKSLRPLLIIPPIITLGILSFFMMAQFGTPLPTAPYSIGKEFFARLMLKESWMGVFGELLDQKWGLFAIAPVYLLVLPGARIFMQRDRYRFLMWSFMVIGFTALMGMYQMWWGGFSPPGRFLIPIVPLLWIPISLFVTERSWSWPRTWLCSSVLIMSLVFSYRSVMSTPYRHQDCSPFLYPEESPWGSSHWASISGEIDWTQILPLIERGGRWSHITPDALKAGRREYQQLLYWFFIITIGTAYSRSRRIQLPMMPPLILLMVWVGIVTGVITGAHYVSSPMTHNNVERRWFSQDLRNGYLSLFHKYHRHPQMGLPYVTYGQVPDIWRPAPPEKYTIFYPAVYAQDFPDYTWPGGYTYRFEAPIRWLPDDQPNRVVLQIENRLDKSKHTTERVNPANSQQEDNLSIDVPIPDGSEALFKVVLYGDKTADFEFMPVRMIALPISAKPISEH